MYDPRTLQFYIHGAESLQLNEQEEANVIAEFIGARFVFAAGIAVGFIVTAALFLIGRFL